jgi:hypothetical protein
MSRSDTDQQKKNREKRGNEAEKWDENKNQSKDQPQEGGTMGQTYTGSGRQGQGTNPGDQQGNQGMRDTRNQGKGGNMGQESAGGMSGGEGAETHDMEDSDETTDMSGAQKESRRSKDTDAEKE